MSIFKEHKTIADRSASDRRRHKKKIEDAIRDGVHNIVADESIIGQDGKKKIKIPVRGIKEYRFVYGDNSQNKKVGSAPGKDVRRGQKVGDAQKGKQPGSDPGDEKGEEYYEVEITLEELTHYLFNDLELPDLARKTITNIVGEKFKRHGYRSQGIRPRLDKKKTAINRIKRKKASEARQKREADGGDQEEERFPYHQNDLKYRHIKKDVKEASNAVIFFLMDISGSMTQTKKFLARSFYFLLYHFINHRYENCEVVFVAHDTNAYEVDEDKFFKRGQSGGTIVSSGLEMVTDIINKRYHPSSWNVYCFQCSDGDNWPSDTEKTLGLITKLKDICQLFGYCEIEPDGERLSWGAENKLAHIYQPMIDLNFKVVKINEKEQIWPAFKKLLGKRVQEVSHG
jgi:sporulation protein YhbH